MAALVFAVLVVFTLERKSGVAWASVGEADGRNGNLAIAVLETSDLERGAFGRVSFEGWGVPPPRLVSAALRNEIFVLREHRDRVRDRRSLDLRRHRPFPNLPVTDGAPPRMDHGGPDPDRLLPSSRPATENAR